MSSRLVCIYLDVLLDGSGCAVVCAWLVRRAGQSDDPPIGIRCDLPSSMSISLDGEDKWNLTEEADLVGGVSLPDRGATIESSAA